MRPPGAAWRSASPRHADRAPGRRDPCSPVAGIPLPAGTRVAAAARGAGPGPGLAAGAGVPRKPRPRPAARLSPAASRRPADRGPPAAGSRPGHRQTAGRGAAVPVTRMRQSQFPDTEREMSDEKFGPPALTFDDVLLLPAHSVIMPSEADTTARLDAAAVPADTAAVFRHGHGD